ncbi:hypothetical protein ACXIUT_14705 [Achromobacter denitrificans]
MENAKWDFQIEHPVHENGAWRIGYTLIAPPGAAAQERIAIDERFSSAQIAIDEATRLAQIHVADLNGDTAAFEKPTDAEVPFGKNPRF